MKYSDSNHVKQHKQNQQEEKEQPASNKLEQCKIPFFQKTSFLFLRFMTQKEKILRNAEKETEKLSHKGHQKSHFEYENREIKAMMVSRKDETATHFLFLLCHCESF